MLEEGRETVLQAEHGDEVRPPDGDVERFPIRGETDGGGVRPARAVRWEELVRLHRGEAEAVHRIGEELIALFADKIEPCMVGVEDAVAGAGPGGEVQGPGGGKAVLQVKYPHLVQTEAGHQQPAAVEEGLVAARLGADLQPADQAQPAAGGLIDQHMAVVVVGGVNAPLVPGQKAGGGVLGEHDVQHRAAGGGGVQQGETRPAAGFGDGGEQAAVPGGVFGVGLGVDKGRGAEDAGIGVQGEAVGARGVGRGVGPDIAVDEGHWIAPFSGA